MTIKEAFQSYLLSLAPLQALVGDRVSFGERRAGDPLPAVTWFRQGGSSVQNSLGPAGMGVWKVVLECWGRTGDEADAVAAAVKGDDAHPALDQFKTAFMGGGGGVWVAGVRVDDLADDRIQPAAGEQRSDHRVTLEVTLWFDE